jgi:hypothetical protein
MSFDGFLVQLPLGLDPTRASGRNAETKVTRGRL